jgi:hypothetical protein
MLKLSEILDLMTDGAYEKFYVSAQRIHQNPNQVTHRIHWEKTDMHISSVDFSVSTRISKRTSDLLMQKYFTRIGWMVENSYWIQLAEFKL